MRDAFTTLWGPNCKNGSGCWDCTRSKDMGLNDSDNGVHPYSRFPDCLRGIWGAFRMTIENRCRLLVIRLLWYLALRAPTYEESPKQPSSYRESLGNEMSKVIRDLTDDH